VSSPLIFKSNEIGKKLIITCMTRSEEILTDYETTCRDFSIDVPEYFNFGFDVVDRWAKKDRNKLAMIWVNQKGEEKKFSFLYLSNLSNQAANILL
jgi:acetyl-CoA synthetase